MYHSTTSTFFYQQLFTLLLCVCRNEKQMTELQSIKNQDRLNTTEGARASDDSSKVVDKAHSPSRKVCSCQYENIYLDENNKSLKEMKFSSHQQVELSTNEDHNVGYCPLNPATAETSYYVTINSKI